MIKTTMASASYEKSYRRNPFTNSGDQYIDEELRYCATRLGLESVKVIDIERK